MSKSNHAERTYIILDRRDVNKSHIRTLGASLLIFILLGILFFIVSQIEEILIYGSVAFMLQLLFGVIATRLYHSWGMKTRAKLAFLDPAMINSKWKLVETELKNGEIERYFERVHTNLEKMDVEITDDINDLAWFAVTVWSICSVILFMIIGARHLLYSVAPPILATLCLFVYFHSYKTNMNGYFSDDVDHLEFLVKSKLSSLKAIAPEKSQVFGLWKVQGNNYVLYDLKIKFSLVNPERNDIIYSMGIPSTEKERFVVKISSEEEYYLVSLDPEYNPYWKISEYFEKSSEFEITNEASVIDLSKRSSFVRINNDKSQAEGVIKIILHELFSNR